jgi:AcrR family transcriptional regulator
MSLVNPHTDLKKEDPMNRSINKSSSGGRPRDRAVDDAILKTAIELFIKHGVEGAGFEQIAKCSGISRAAIYRRWKSKEALLVAALKSTKQPPHRTPQTIATLNPGELIDLFRETLTDALTRQKPRALIAQLIGSIPEHPELMAVYREEFIEPFWQAMTKVLDKARSAGGLPRLPDQELLRDLLAGAVIHRLLMQTDNRNVKKEKAWVERLLRQLGLTADAI